MSTGSALAIHQDAPAAPATFLPEGFSPAAQALEFVQNLAAFERLAVAISKSGMVQDRPEAVLAKMLKGMELGLPPMAAQAGIDFFDGKLSVRSHMQLAIASSRYGVRCEALVSNATECTLRLSRPGWAPVEEGYTIAEAKQAGLLGKKNWVSYPKDMLYNRALSRGIKRICPEVGAGVYDPDELGAVTSPDGTPEPQPRRQEKSPGAAAAEHLKRAEAAEIVEPDPARAAEVSALRATAVVRGASGKFLKWFDGIVDAEGGEGHVSDVALGKLQANLDNTHPAPAAAETPEREPGEDAEELPW